MSKSNNNLLIKNLTDFGLSDKEAVVYLSLLELELAGVQEIAKKAGINRSSTYVVLESLKAKGLVGTSDDKKVRQFVAASPEMLHRVASEQARKQEEIRKSINEIVPELKALHKATKLKPKVSVFEGKEGLMAAFEDILYCKEKLVRISSSLMNLVTIIPQNFFPDFVQKRISLGIKMHGIHPNDGINKKLMEIHPGFDTPILIPKDKYKFPADMAIYDDKIGYMSPENGGIAILIENKEIANVMKNMFDLAWEEAKRLNKEANEKEN